MLLGGGVGSGFSTASLTLVSVSWFSVISTLRGKRWHLVVLICLFLVISDPEHLFMCFLAIVCLLWRNVPSGPLSIFERVFLFLFFFFGGGGEL